MAVTDAFGRFSPVPAAERFAASYRVDRSGCWLWVRSVDTAGYGRLRVDGRLMPAHRFALVLAGVELVPDRRVTQRCSIRRCVNPEHLEQVTRWTR